MKLILLLFTILLCAAASFSQLQNTVVISEKCTNSSSSSPTYTGASTSTIVATGRLSFLSFFFTCRTYVEFDLSGIPPNAIVTSAYLKLFVESTAGSPVIHTARITEPWLENNVSWSDQPDYTTDDQVTAAYFDIFGWLGVNVKDHIQKMVAGVYPNYGWMLYHNNETENANKFHTFRSDDYAGTDYDPKLEISYYIPMSVSDAAIVHESVSGAGDGSVSPVLADGPGGTYSYQWFNSSGTMPGKTALNLTGVPYGWYGLRVTSSIAGTAPFYYAFLVGLNCENVPVEFNPGPDFIDDAVLKNTYPSSLNAVTNYGNANTWDAVDIYTTVQHRTPIRFRLWVDEELNLTEAVLTMKGVGNESNRSNVSHLKRIVEEWQENIITYSSMPGVSTDIVVNIPEMTSAMEVKNIDISDFWEFWQQNHDQNHGFLFELQTYGGGLAIQAYHSSDAAAAANRPKISFNVGVYDGACFSYSELKRKLDGGYSYAAGGKLKFTMDEEYEQDASKYLPFRIYDKNHQLLESSDPDGVVLNSSVSPLPLQFDDNRWTLDISAIPGMVTGEYYILEVSGSKGDKRYLRFYYKN